MGATLYADGASFRVWAPRALAVEVRGEFSSWQASPDGRLQDIGGGHWAGFVPGLKDGARYLFWVDGRGSRGPKRDPRARDLGVVPAFPACACVVRDPDAFPWHDP